MKENIFMITGCAMLLSISSITYSSEGPYVSGNLGVSMPSNSSLTDSTAPDIKIEIESDLGLALGAAVGYGFANNTRIEGEIAYTKNDADKASQNGVDVDLTGDTSSLAFLLNGYYDFTNKSQITTSITAGLGVAKVELNDFNVSGSGLPSANYDDTVFAYQVGIGVGYAVNQNVIVDVKYRYFGTSDVQFDTTEVEYSGGAVYAGTRYSF
jgi:opacity protein-like surface antigen